jgi:dienelactone hydrolase
LEHLATWGYFVIATESGMELFPNHSNYADDLRYALTHVETANADPASWLFGQVDVAHFGVAGHSMGGGASILAAARDTRVDAVVNMAAAETNPSATASMPAVQVPIRLIVGSADGIVSPSTTQAMYNNGHPPRQFANIQGGWHCGFLDSNNLGCDSGSMARAAQLQRTRRLLTEFFNLYLKGDQAPWRAVWGPEWDDDLQVIIDRDAGLALAPDAQTSETYFGAAAAYELTLTNSTPYATSYTLLAEENAWPVVFSPAVTPSLAPDQVTTVQVTVWPPTATSSPQDSILVSARSDRDNGTRSYARIETHALTFAAGIARAGDALALTWTASDANCSYQVHRSTVPYFSPAAGTLIETLPPGSSATADETPGILNDPTVNYAYLVRAVCGASVVDSGYLGEFDFGLIPGIMP